MARNFSFLKSRRFWVFSIAGVALVFGVFLFLVQKAQKPVSLPGANEEDSIPPATAIISPEDRTWHRAGFSVVIRDSDIGAGLASFAQGKQGCQYRVEDFGADTVFGGYRKCGSSNITISVGKDMACSSSYMKDSSQGRCRISTKAVDQAGNESEWKSSLFFVDMEKPIVGSVSVAQGSSQGAYMLRGQVTDNGKIVSCGLFQDNQALEGVVSFDSLPCQEGRVCSMHAQYTPQDEGIHTVRFGCQDAAGNTGYGEPLSSLSFINQAPDITLCRVMPSQGGISTVFQFKAQVSDPNSDTLLYRWEFGDGKEAIEQNPAHTYKASGTYVPKLTVRDSAGATDECDTAWVIIQE